MDLELFQTATGGYKEVPDDWVSGTGLRALIQGDPALLWLKFHGAKHGLVQDSEEYSFLNWIGDKGRAFEEAWIKNACPGAIQAMDADVDVTRLQGLTRTLALMARKVPVITKAALWWAPERIFGSADLIVLTSWLYAKFPHLKPASADGGPEHYVIVDAKFTTGLHTNEKKTDLACNSAQVRLYSFILGQLQGVMPENAYLVTRDRPFDPLPVAVDHRLDAPLDPHLVELRDLHTHIKLHGKALLPWRADNEIVKCNFSNSHDDPWHDAKKRIATEFLPGRPLEWLPHIGRSQVAELNTLGITNIEQVLDLKPASMDWEALKGIGKTTAPRIRAVLDANRSGRPSVVPAALVPRRAAAEFFIDFEFLSNVNVDFENDFPAMTGHEMVFMVGVGWERAGLWHYRQFVAEAETAEAERAMFEEFLNFLQQAGALKLLGKAALYHWTNAEVSQSTKAAERLGLPRLATLPWYDLQTPFHEAPVAMPEAWGFGLKEIAKSLGTISPEHRVEWPSLDSGLAASVMGWKMYESSEPLETGELKMLSKYLEIDCKAMWAVLSWMRSVAVEGAHWYEKAGAAPKGKQKPPPSKTRRKTKQGPTKKRSRRRASGVGWYREICGWALRMPLES